MSHTPKPWIAEQVKNRFEVYMGDGDGPGPFATVQGGNNAANAHLIAAAPELLTALRGLVNQIDAVAELPYRFNGELLDAARAAIAKAEGAQ